jgi:hypothetical protein
MSTSRSSRSTRGIAPNRLIAAIAVRFAIIDLPGEVEEGKEAMMAVEKHTNELMFESEALSEEKTTPTAPPSPPSPSPQASPKSEPRSEASTSRLGSRPAPAPAINLEGVVSGSKSSSSSRSVLLSWRRPSARAAAAAKDEVDEAPIKVESIAEESARDSVEGSPVSASATRSPGTRSPTRSPGSSLADFDSANLTPDAWLEASATLDSDSLLFLGMGALEAMPAATRGLCPLVPEVADLLVTAGRDAEARLLLSDAVQARRDAFGSRAPATLTALNALGCVLLDLARPPKIVNDPWDNGPPPRDYDPVVAAHDIALARECFAEAAEARRETQGETHLETLTALNNLGSAHFAAGDLEAAEELYRECLHSRREVLGEDDPDTYTSMNNLGELLLVRHKVVESGVLLAAAYSGAGRHPELGWDHALTRVILANLRANRDLRARVRDFYSRARPPQL